MNNEDYLNTQYQLILLAKIINDLDLVGFLERINTAQGFGCFIDPITYSMTAEKLENLRRLAQVALKFQIEVHRQIQRSYDANT